MNNLISAYVDFKKEKILKCCSVFEDENDNILEKYIDTYVRCYYYHILGTLNEKDVIDYDYQVVAKELEGTGLELIEELGEKFVDKIKDCYSVALASITIDRINFSSSFTIDEIEHGLSVLINKKMIPMLTNAKITSLAKIIKKHLTTETKFLKHLDSDDFKLVYDKYKNKEDLFFIDIDYDIKQLTTNYKDNSIDKVLNSKELVENKTYTIINMISVDILLKMINQEKIDNYFINLDEMFIDENKINEIFNKVNNELLKKHIIFIIKNSNYKRHKQFLNNHESILKYALLIDMSHINDVPAKLTVLEALPIFNYIILDKIKSKDYETVIKYEFVNDKVLVINDFENEGV